MMNGEGPRPIPLTELNKWCGISYLDVQYKENVRLAYVFNNVTALVSMADEFYMVGKNEQGSLGSGSDVEFDTKVPMRVDFLCNRGITSLAVGTDNIGPQRGIVCSFFALGRDGRLFCWGNNTHGNLGLRYISSVAEPIHELIITRRDEVKTKQISCGDGHTLALSETGEVWAWGRSIHGQVGNKNRQDHPFPVKVIPNGIRQIACGKSHSAALTEDGRVYTWGNNDKGQLGLGPVIGDILEPKEVTFPSGAGKFIKIACGKYHTVALTDSGKVYSWGSNIHGELGIGYEEEETKDGNKNSLPCPSPAAASSVTQAGDKSCFPVFLTMKEEAGAVRDIAAVPQLSVTVCQTETRVFMWGNIPHWQDQAVDLPWETFMPSISDVFSTYLYPPITYQPITFDNCHLYSHFAVNPELVKWGPMKYVDPNLLQRTRLGFVCGIGYEHTGIVVTREDETILFGKDWTGSLGKGTIKEHFETNHPIQNKKLSHKRIKTFSFGLDIVGGAMCLFALTEVGEIYSWGYNDYAELGLGYASPSPIYIPPTRIEGALKGQVVHQIISGSDHNFAITETNELFSWGYNYFGQCGVGLEIDQIRSPQKVLIKDKVLTVAGGMFHSVAVTTSGQVYAFGKNEHSQLGIPSHKDGYSFKPLRVKIPNNDRAEKVVCGPDSTLLLTVQGFLYFWGFCDLVGNEASSPVRICTDKGRIQDIGTAHWSTMFACQTTDGKVYVWGKLKGRRKVQKLPKEEFRAASVSDAFAMFSVPSVMLTPIQVEANNNN